ncbi:DUF3120 domain-containing protein [Leptolyngbya sp. FACHB-261]|nr:DUF3120 domain-containing protein [Leptolyngbya sp. FACHB-261]
MPVWTMASAAAFLVSVPVFVQAPLVRAWPWVGLLVGGLWVALSIQLMGEGQTPRRQLWGSLLLGFALTWLTGGLYWGWLRSEPLLHLPLEALGVPFALWKLRHPLLRVGNYFYLGSLVGTVVTDAYFYLVQVIPHWRQLMRSEPELAAGIFRSALVQVQTPWGVAWAAVLATLLLSIGVIALRQRSLHWAAFGGAVLSTILVDGLFWLAACWA